jgi:hypothetical protein
MSVSPPSAIHPDDVKFPPGSTKLAFAASADPATAVNITYQIESHPNVKFSNGQRTTQRLNAPVGTGITTVSKDVTFIFDGTTAPVGAIHVNGSVTEVGGSSSFSVTWDVKVEATSFALNESAPAMLAEAPKPNEELVVLMRRACRLLESLLECCQQSATPSTATPHARNTRKRGKSPAKRRK